MVRRVARWYERACRTTVGELCAHAETTMRQVCDLYQLKSFVHTTVTLTRYLLIVSGRVLIVDANVNAAENLAQMLGHEDYEFIFAHSGQEGLALSRQLVPPEVVFIEGELPDMAGTELCRQIRQSAEGGSIPIVVVSDRGEDIDRVVAFELGADDYLVRPINDRELQLRTKAILRRCYRHRQTDTELRAKDLRVDREARRAWNGTELLHLTDTEFRLLEVLLLRRGRGQHRTRLLQDVWGAKSEATPRTVDTHIRRLREKLGESARYLRTIRGIGYSFETEDPQ